MNNNILLKQKPSGQDKQDSMSFSNYQEIDASDSETQSNPKQEQGWQSLEQIKLIFQANLKHPWVFITQGLGGKLASWTGTEKKQSRSARGSSTNKRGINRRLKEEGQEIWSLHVRSRGPQQKYAPHSFGPQSSPCKTLTSENSKIANQQSPKVLKLGLDHSTYTESLKDFGRCSPQVKLISKNTDEGCNGGGGDSSTNHKRLQYRTNLSTHIINTQDKSNGSQNKSPPNKGLVLNHSLCDKDLHSDDLQIQQCRQFAKKYMKLMSVLFTIIILKRVFVDERSDVSKLFFHLLIVVLFMICLRLHQRNTLATRIIPLVIACLSYYGHTKFLILTQKIEPPPVKMSMDAMPQKQVYNSCNQTNCAEILVSCALSQFLESQTIGQFSSLLASTVENQSSKIASDAFPWARLPSHQQFAEQWRVSPSNVPSPHDINEILRTIIIFGAFFINHIYIDIFLTVKPVDSIIVNGVTWGLFIFNAFRHPDMSLSTKLSILTLAMFVLKFSIDARTIKDQVFLSFKEQKSLNQQWISIFKKLPVGIVIANGQKVMHTNKKMHEFTGAGKIRTLNDLDNHLSFEEKLQTDSGKENATFKTQFAQNGREEEHTSHQKISDAVANEDIVTFESFSHGYCSKSQLPSPLAETPTSPPRKVTQNTQKQLVKKLIGRIKHQFFSSEQKQESLEGKEKESHQVDQSHNRIFIQSKQKLNCEDEQATGNDYSPLKHLGLAAKNEQIKVTLPNMGPEQQSFTVMLEDVLILGTKLTIIIFVDITQQEREYKAALEQKYKNIFLSSVSHQLRTPLNILQLNNNIMREVFRDNSFAMDILEADQKTQDLLNYQIADILDFSKIEANEFKTNFTEFNLPAFMKKIKNIFEPMAVQKKLFFNMNCNLKIPEAIYQDEQRLGQVLVNILGNAVKFTTKGTVAMGIESNEKENELKIEVRDTGKGIKKLHTVGHIFGNLDIVNNVNQSGIGFGITISKKLIERLGGHITFQNVLSGLANQNDQIVGLQVSIVFPWELPKNPFKQDQILKNLGSGLHLNTLAGAAHEESHRQPLLRPNSVESIMIQKQQSGTSNQVSQIKGVSYLQLMKEGSKRSLLNKNIAPSQANISANQNVQYPRRLLVNRREGSKISSMAAALNVIKSNIPSQLDSINNCLLPKKRISGGKIGAPRSRLFSLNLPAEQLGIPESKGNEKKMPPIMVIPEKSKAPSSNEGEKRKSSVMSEALTLNDVREEDLDLEDYITIEEKVCLHTTKDLKTLVEKQTSQRLGPLFKRPHASVQFDDTPQEQDEEEEYMDLIGSNEDIEDLGSLNKFENQVIQDSSINNFKERSKVYSKYIKHQDFRETTSITGKKQQRSLLRGKRTSKKSCQNFNLILRKLKVQEMLIKEVAELNSNLIHAQQVDTTPHVSFSNHREVKFPTMHSTAGQEIAPLNKQIIIEELVYPDVDASQNEPYLQSKSALIRQSNVQNQKSILMTIGKELNHSTKHHFDDVQIIQRAQIGLQDCCNRVLVVDDNPFNVKSIEMMLEHCFKIKCDSAFSGEEGLKLVEKRIEKLHKFGCSEYYRLILTDINMPEMDGIEMTKQIRERCRNNMEEEKEVAFHSVSSHISPLSNQYRQTRKQSRNVMNECIIWAITAMNETEIQDMVGTECLNGISVKPLCYKQLADLLYSYNLISHVAEN